MRLNLKQLLQFNPSNSVLALPGALIIGSYVFASLPGASAAGAGAIAYCSDVGSSGFYLRSNGTIWLPAWQQTLFRVTVPIDYTGGTTVQMLSANLIPGGFLHANAVLRITGSIGRSAGTGGNVTAQIRVGGNTSGTSTTIYSNGATSPVQRVQRDLIFQNSLSSQLSPSPGNNASFAAGGSVPSALTYNFASDQYITAALQLANAADTGTVYSFLVECMS